MNKMKTVYLHENGNYVIWGLSEYFESSDLVKKIYNVPADVADSQDFRHMIKSINTRHRESQTILADVVAESKATYLELDRQKTLVKCYKTLLSSLNWFQKWVINYKDNQIKEY